MRHLVFSREWFWEHQEKLLTIINIPVIGGEFRSLLGIKTKWPIVNLQPHYYTTANPDGTFTAEFHTHSKFSKRLYHQFYYLWRTMHEWDHFVANPLVPALNLGFDSLTTFPNAGDPGTTTCDGAIRRSSAGEAWLTAFAGASNLSADMTLTTIHTAWIRNSSASNYDIVDRGAYLFDTSPLGASASITGATFSLFGIAQVDTGSKSPNLDVYTATTASNTTLAAGDSVGSVSQTGSPMAYASFSTTGYNDFTFNATGRGNINKTGVSKFGTRNANYDVAAVDPGGTNNEFKFDIASADTTGSANDPKLVVTFTLPAGAPTFAPTVMTYTRSWRQ